MYDEQLHQTFVEDGFVAVRGFLSPDQVGQVHDNLQRVIRDVVPNLPRETVYYEDVDDKSTLKQIQQLGQADAFFGRMQNEGPLRELSELLMGEETIPWNMQYFNKPPGKGLPTPPHQDGFYFKLDPCEALTAWLALEEVDEENGCLHYVRGSHRRGMRPHTRSTTLGFSQGINDFGTAEDVEHEVTMRAAPGDLLVHHAMTIHRADENRSKTRTRQALGFMDFAASAREDSQAQAAYQAQLNKDRIDAGQI